MNIELMYYVQTDGFCLLLLFILFFSFLKVREKTQDQKLYHMFVVSTIWFCIADLMAWVFNGKEGIFCCIMLHMSNMAFFISSTLVGLLWCFYVLEKTGKTHLHAKRRLLIIIPFALFVIFVLLSPVHKMIYRIDYVEGTGYEYVRAKYLWIHWAVVGAYIFLPCMYVLYRIINEWKYPEKKKYYPLFWVLIFPIITTVIQILFYRSSLLQVGMTIAALYIYIRQQNLQAYNDELTDLHNRRYLNFFVEEKMDSMPKNTEIFLLMLDVDQFKLINDTHGHVMGDNVLKTMGWILKKACQKRKNIISARYGGDEFVVFGYNYTKSDIVDLISDINTDVQVENLNDPEIKVSLSIGYVDGALEEFDNFEMLITEADTEMYKIKSRKRTTY